MSCTIKKLQLAKSMLLVLMFATLGCNSDDSKSDRGALKEPVDSRSSEHSTTLAAVNAETSDEWGNFADADRTDDERFWGGYEEGVVYETTCELLYDGSDLGEHFYWPLKDSARYKIELSEYDRNPSRFEGVTRIPSGTKFKITLIQEIRRTTFRTVWTTATFIDGPCREDTFNVSGISKHKPSNNVDYNLPFPAPEFAKASGNAN